MKISDIPVKGRISDVIRAAELLEEVSPLTLSRLQRRLEIGYGRVAAILDLFEALEIISPSNILSHEHTPLVTPREAVIRVIAYLHEAFTSEDWEPLCSEESEPEDEESEDRVFVLSVEEPDSSLMDWSDPDFTDEPEDEDEKPAVNVFALPKKEPLSPLTDGSDPDFTEEPEPVVPLSSRSPEALLRQAVECACSRERIGVSALQRTLYLGYGRAAKLMDRMEELGIVGPDLGTKTGRLVLLTLEEALARLPAEED